jgi:Carboxypeptidase regulatory-like domain
LRILRIWLLTLAAIAIAVPLAAQDVDRPKPEAGHITGTVTDVNNDPVPGATVVLEGSDLSGPRTVVSNDNGFFEFNDLESGSPYQVAITAQGFANWASPTIILKPGETLILTGSKLQIAEAQTTVSVVYSAEEVATEEVKIEEKQRVLGIIPNFYVVYDHNAEPLTTKLKFKLAFRTSIDPVTITGVGVLAAINQAADIPNYGQGWGAYGKRFGAAAADGLSDIMIGGAILPSLLHQDPRYFYQGEGTTKSRALHALSSPFVCRGDNGRMQPNYSTIGGDLASAAISNAYYPASNRGVGQTFETVLINTGERMLSSVIQEFLLGKLTSKGRHKD